MTIIILTCYVLYTVLSVRLRLNKRTDTFEAAMDLAFRDHAFRKVVPSWNSCRNIMSGALLSHDSQVDDFVVTHFNRGAGINTISTLIYSEVKIGIEIIAI